MVQMVAILLLTLKQQLAVEAEGDFQLLAWAVVLVVVVVAEIAQLQVALLVRALLVVEVLVVEATVAEAVVVALEPQEQLL